MGGRGNLVYPRSKVYPTGEGGRKLKQPPPDFRERYLEDGWDYHWDLNCGWKTFCRWIDQCGGEELRAARAAHVKERITREGPRVRTCIGTASRSDSRWHKKRRR